MQTSQCFFSFSDVVIFDDLVLAYILFFPSPATTLCVASTVNERASVTCAVMLAEQASCPLTASGWECLDAYNICAKLCVYLVCFMWKQMGLNQWGEEGSVRTPPKCFI